MQAGSDRDSDFDEAGVDLPSGHVPSASLNMTETSAAREAAKLMQRSLAAALPAWLGRDHVTIAKAETNRRRSTLPEIREYSRACGTTNRQTGR